MNLNLEAVLRRMTRTRVGEPTEEKLQKALEAWGRWYSQRLDAIVNKTAPKSADYSGYEQDLYDADGFKGVLDPVMEGLILEANSDCNICRGQTERLCNHDDHPWSKK